jgi:DNA-binding GntR family transcriptional regulator
MQTRANTTSDLIYKEIKNEILSEQLVHGNRLVETSIAQRHNVNKIHVSYALQKLASEGLVEYKPRRGYFVQGVDTSDFLEIVKIREILEFELSRNFFTYATEENFQEAANLTKRKLVFLENGMNKDADAETEHFFTLVQSVSRLRHIPKLHAQHQKYLMSIVKNDFFVEESTAVTIKTTEMLLEALQKRDLDLCLAWVEVRHDNLVKTRYNNFEVTLSNELEESEIE